MPLDHPFDPHRRTGAETLRAVLDGTEHADPGLMASLAKEVLDEYDALRRLTDAATFTRLAFPDGDVLLARLADDDYTADQVAAVASGLHAAFPDYPCVIVPPDVKLLSAREEYARLTEILRAADPEPQTAGT